MIKIMLTSVNESNLLGKEIWKVSCKNSLNTYEVSNFGNVRKNGKGYECKVNRDGYKGFTKYYVHREVYRLFIGEIPEKFHVHHIDNDTQNNFIWNLQCLSPSDHVKKLKHSESTKKKISEAHTGKHLSQSTRKKISEAKSGHVVSESTRKKISEAKSGENCSESTRKKISEAKSGEKAPKAKLTYKKVTKIREFLSEGKLTQAEIAIMFNVSQSTISYIKNGRIWKKP